MDLQKALDPIGDIVSLIGSDTFGSGFYRAVDSLIGVDHCTVFLCGEGNPRTLLAEAYTEKTADRVRGLAQSYIRDGYRHDPIWDNCKQNARSECSTFVLSPMDMADERYRQEFYVKPNIKHELALTATVNGDRIYAAFYREHGRNDFSRDNVDLIKQCGRAFMQVLHKHAEISLAAFSAKPETRPVSHKELLERVRSAISQDCKLLTTREAEICASIVLGYTVLGISMNLGISVNTVATHRKRAYAKLRVSSQNELFARYFSTVENNINVLRYN